MKSSAAKEATRFFSISPTKSNQKIDILEFQYRYENEMFSTYSNDSPHQLLAFKSGSRCMNEKPPLRKPALRAVSGTKLYSVVKLILVIPASS